MAMAGKWQWRENSPVEGIPEKYPDKRIALSCIFT
jgi:hypothetical protein